MIAVITSYSIHYTKLYDIVDRIEVYKTDDKRKVKLNVVLKMFSDSVDFEIERARGKTSVCNRLYT